MRLRTMHVGGGHRYLTPTIDESNVAEEQLGLWVWVDRESRRWKLVVYSSDWLMLVVVMKDDTNRNVVTNVILVTRSSSSPPS